MVASTARGYRWITVLFCTCMFVGAKGNWVSKFGPFRAVLYSDWITCDHDRTLQMNVEDIQIYFYDFANNINLTYKIDEAAAGITNSTLDYDRKLIFFVPGYKSHIYRKTEELIRQTFKNVSNTYLIIVDHSEYTNPSGGRIKSYERSVLYSYYIGKALGEFLADIHEKRYPSKNIHCVGHSLGSQILAYAGETYTNRTGEKVWRITALDPAGPCFSNSFISDQIRTGLAEYVEVYHCNGGGLGTTSVLGDVDFFFNEAGSTQPDCHGSIIPGLGESSVAKCSHKACVRFWAKTVHNPEWYLAWSCDSYKVFSKGRCAGNEVAIAGYSNPGNATGVFYTSTDGYDV